MDAFASFFDVLSRFTNYSEKIIFIYLFISVTAKVFITCPSLEQNVVTILGFNVLRFFIGGKDIKYSFRAIIPAKAIPIEITKNVLIIFKIGDSKFMLLELTLYLLEVRFFVQI